MNQLINFLVFASNGKVLVALITFIVSLVLIVWLSKKYNLNKLQLLMFVLLVLFWASINIIRSYRRVYAISPAEFGGLGIDGLVTASIVSAYGLISIFARLPIFVLSDWFQSRKWFIALALWAIMLSSIYVVVKPDATSLYLSSLALGLGASMLALFNVMFSETFDSKDALVSVSILSIAPLMAEFLVAPLQTYATQEVVKNYTLLWSLSAVLALIAFVLLLQLKDNKTKVTNFSLKTFFRILFTPRFIFIALFGVLVSFIRFSTSQANMVAYARTDLVNMSSLLVAYLDVVFTLFQLGAGVMVGLYFKQKFGIKWTLVLGLSLSGLFALIGGLSTHDITLFFAYGLNGFGYGISYNLLLGLALSSFLKEEREMSMGIYQTFFAIGIYYGDQIYGLVLRLIPGTVEGAALYQTVFLGTAGVVGFLIGLVLLVVNGRIKQGLET
ncbi:MAG: MFS transporter [Erysipelothrix sp.]|nr:MFS transporter [Erysipelothrix sp.]